MPSAKLNLGCGPVYVDSADWLNLDFVTNSESVLQANLLERLPVDEGSVQLVYSSHFLEHIPKPQVKSFLAECFRVLKSGGVLRLVLPDLEEMARSYLMFRDAGEHKKADFLVVEMVDQCVRRESSGELGKLYRHLRASEDSTSRTEMIDFVRMRTGEELAPSGFTAPAGWGGAADRSARRVMQRVSRRLQQAWIRLVLLGLSGAFRAQNVSLAGVGERHHWLWDFHQLHSVLEEVGFTVVSRWSANTSSVADFPFYPLDLDAGGRARKGMESMYVEAFKPN